MTSLTTNYVLFIINISTVMISTCNTSFIIYYSVIGFVHLFFLSINSSRYFIFGLLLFRLLELIVSSCVLVIFIILCSLVYCIFIIISCLIEVIVLSVMIMFLSYVFAVLIIDYFNFIYYYFVQY